MSTIAPLQTLVTKPQPLSSPSPAGLLLQRKCACGSPTSSLTGECAQCKSRKRLQTKPIIGAGNDSLEQEADRVAGQTVGSKTLAVSSVTAGRLQREDAPKEKSNEEKYQEGLAKLGEAFLQTPLGKELQEKIKQDALVKGATEFGKEFISTLPGKIVTGAAATGAVAALAATHKALPAQVPAIPLDRLVPGLSVQLTYKGPVDKPTEAMITFSFSEQAPKGSAAKKPLSEAEKFRAETARMAAENAKFQASMTYAPGSPEDVRQKAEQEAIRKAAMKYSDGPDIDATIKKYPWLATPQPKSSLQLTMPKSPFGIQMPSLPGDEFKLELPGEKKKKQDDPALQKKLSVGASNDPLEQEADRVAEQVMAAPAGASVGRAPLQIQRFTDQAAGHVDAAAPISVDRVLGSSGRPLAPALRQDMEQRFGHDFSQVRVHSDSAAGQSAREVNAHAYTVGHSIVFGAGRFIPESHDGRRLIAHELAHVVQQSGGAPTVQRQPSGDEEAPTGATGSTLCGGSKCVTDKEIYAAYDDAAKRLDRIELAYQIGAKQARRREIWDSVDTSNVWYVETLLLKDARFVNDLKRVNLSWSRSKKEFVLDPAVFAYEHALSMKDDEFDRLTKSIVWNFTENPPVLRSTFKKTMDFLCEHTVCKQQLAQFRADRQSGMSREEALQKNVARVIAWGYENVASLGAGGEAGPRGRGPSAGGQFEPAPATAGGPSGRAYGMPRGRVVPVPPVVLPKPTAAPKPAAPAEPETLPSAPKPKPITPVSKPAGTPTSAATPATTPSPTPTTAPAPMPFPGPGPSSPTQPANPRRPPQSCGPAVLRLPSQKGVHEQRSRGLIREGRLINVTGRDRPNAQAGRWDRYLRPGGAFEMYHEIWLQFDRLGTLEARRLRPNWTKNRYTGLEPLEVDHMVELQVTLPNEQAIWDSVPNYELLDRESNGASGRNLYANITAERVRIAACTGDPSWMTRDLQFDALVVLPGPAGERWLLDEIHEGKHYFAFVRLLGE